VSCNPGEVSSPLRNAMTSIRCLQGPGSIVGAAVPFSLLPRETSGNPCGPGVPLFQRGHERGGLVVARFYDEEEGLNMPTISGAMAPRQMRSTIPSRNSALARE